MGDDFDMEEEAPKAEDILEEEILIYMPIVYKFSDFELCTDQKPEDRCRQCTWDCPCRPRPPPIPTKLPRPKNPNKCTRCKETIIVPTKYVWPKATPFRYSVFGDLHYHRRCFRCQLCDRSIFVEVMIKENKNVFRYNNDIVCPQCNWKLHALWCNTCAQPIRFNRVKCEDKEYHRDCLRCTTCGININGHKRSSHHLGKPYCAICITKLFATKCTQCGVLIPKGLQSFSFKGQMYHFGCFRCALCDVPLINPAGADKPVMMRGSTKLCVDCVPKHCSNCNQELPRGPGHYEMDETGVIKCLECTHIGYNRNLKGKKLPPPAIPAQVGTGIEDISYPDSESEESGGDETEEASGRKRSLIKRKKKKTFSTWGPQKKPEALPPKKMSNDLKVTEELFTIYMFHTDDGVEVVPAHVEEVLEER